MRFSPWLAISTLFAVGALAQPAPQQTEQQREYRRTLAQSVQLQEAQRLADQQRQAQQQREADERAEEQRRALTRAERERDDRHRAEELLVLRRAEAERQRHSQIQQSEPQERQQQSLANPVAALPSVQHQPRYDFSPALLARSFGVGLLAGAFALILSFIRQEH
jgi:hypothetical protein